jgi:hypothetical protein
LKQPKVNLSIPTHSSATYTTTMPRNAKLVFLVDQKREQVKRGHIEAPLSYKVLNDRLWYSLKRECSRHGDAREWVRRRLELPQ